MQGYRKVMKKKTFFIMALGCGLAFLPGCWNDITDPTQIGRFEPTPTVSVVLDSLGVADEPSPTYEGAEKPRPADLVDIDTDYVFGSGDVVRISIFELYQSGQIFANDYVVTETGRISLPDVGQVQAAGLTESQLEQQIRDILSPSILKSPAVTVSLYSSQSRYFSIVGQGIGQAARFPIPRYTFRLTDAIALAQGVAEFNVSYIYVSRDVPEMQAVAESAQPAAEKTKTSSEVQSPPIELHQVSPKPLSPEDEMMEIIAPTVAKKQSGILITSAEMAGRQELENLAAPEGVTPEPPSLTKPVADQNPLPPTQPQSEQVQWVFEDGKWKPVRTGDAETRVMQEPTVPVSQQQGLLPNQPAQQYQPAQRYQPEQQPEATPRGFGLESLGTRGKVTRVIQIPRDRLLAGDPQYDIVIRPGDRITVPVDIVGEFWILGNVNQQGAITLTGRPITLKMAIASAGGLGPLAIPQKVEVVRRIGKNKAGLVQEETVMVDLNKIAKGLQPDFFIKPYDLVNVGTTGTSRWLAGLRTAFRATYGFGFIYDRNFNGQSFSPFTDTNLGDIF
jgi:protein involved in polysaccharide export with SLBB domain